MRAIMICLPRLGNIGVPEARSIVSSHSMLDLLNAPNSHGVGTVTEQDMN